MRKTIPQAVIAVAAEHAATAETHPSLDSLFMYAGCPGDPPAGSKHVKALDWLRATNTDPAVKAPLEVLGKVIEGYMDEVLTASDHRYEVALAFRQKITAALGNAGLQYRPGGIVTPTLAAPTKTLAHYIKERNERGITEEFERAAAKADTEPREAVSAAANILEALCKHYIAEEGLKLPDKQVLGDLWSVVRKDLGFDPSQIADTDLKQILAGLIQVVQGLAAFRTHASSAHGAGPKVYRLQPRHSRLAVHAAHTTALFILESWDNKKRSRLPRTKSRSPQVRKRSWTASTCSTQLARCTTSSPSKP